MRGSNDGSVVARVSESMNQHRSTSRAASFAALLLLGSGCLTKDAEVGVFDVPQHVGDAGSNASHHPPGSSTALAVTLTSSATELCPGDCVELVASASGGQGPYQYNWELAGAAGPGPQHVCPIEPTTYLVTVIDSQFSDTGLEVGARVTVTRAASCPASDPPDAGDDAPASPLGLTLTASAPEVCPGECVDLTASASGGLTPYQYNWELPELSGPGPQQVCPTETTTYQAFAFDADFERTGMEVGASTQVTVRASCDGETSDEGPLAITLSSSADGVCAGECVELTATASGGRAPYQYNWEGNDFEGSGPHSVCPTETTTYWAFAFDADFETNHLEVGAQKVVTVEPCP